jgi:hypothetical protein
VSKLLQKLVKQLSLRLTVVQLVDATQCRDATQFLSATVISLATMVRLELPTICVLSKADLLLASDPDDMLFGMDYFLDCQSLDRLLDYLDGSRAPTEGEADIADEEDYQKARLASKHSAFQRKHRKLFQGLAEVRRRLWIAALSTAGHIQCHIGRTSLAESRSRQWVCLCIRQHSPRRLIPSGNSRKRESI